MSCSPNVRDKLPLTFGIEMEHVFGIKQEFVRSHPAYSWVFPENCTLDAEVPNSPRFDPLTDQHSGLLQAVKILRSRGAPLKAILPCEEEESYAMYSRWNMTLDRSIRFPGNARDLEVLTDGRIKDWLGWEFFGLELLSPALRVPDFDSYQYHSHGLAEVQNYLRLMARPPPGSPPCFFASSPVTGGLHVHIGLQPQPDGQQDLPINFLRHLAFICLAFEDTLTLLHHPQRRNLPMSYSRGHIGSNRFVGKLPQTYPRHNCWKGPGFSPEDAFLRIFRAKDNNDLVELLTTIETEITTEPQYMVRECFVNFNNCFNFGPATGKRTIEFRQHHGTLAEADICQWVTFVTALSRAAERKANEEPPTDGTLPPSIAPKILAANPGTQAEPLKTAVSDTPIDELWQDTASNLDSLTGIIRESSKYADLFQINKRRTLKQLFDLLELPVHIRHYWWERAKNFRVEWEIRWRGMGTCEELCGEGDVRDSEGWVDGELDVPPWDDHATGATVHGDSPAPSGLPPFAQLCKVANQLIDLPPCDFAAVMRSRGWPDGQSADQSTDVEVTDDGPTATTVAGPSSTPYGSSSDVMSISAIINRPGLSLP